MPVISAHDVSKSYRGRPLYNNVTFDIEAGSITSVEGPNGSGKSVLFRLMCGFLAPDSGSIAIDPKYLSGRRTFPDKFGVIIDRPAYLPGRTGLANLHELAAIRHRITTEQVKDTMRLVGLSPDLKQKVRHYSLGMKQKLALAQAIMEEPEVLVLDEPFNALDTDSVQATRDLLVDLNSRGVTIVFTSHNREDIEALSTRRLVIRDESVVTVPHR